MGISESDMNERSDIDIRDRVETGVRRQLMLAGFAGGVVTLLAVAGVYALSGRLVTPTGIADSPQAVSRDASVDAMRRYLGIGHEGARERPSKVETTLGSVDDMIARLKARLAKTPGDLNGWRMLGWANFNTDQFAEAAAAYGEAVKLAPGNGEFLSLQGEALVRVADGIVTGEARELFARALAADRSERRARFFEGLAQEQAGEGKAALATWKALLADSPGDGEWEGGLRKRIGELANRLGVDAGLPPSAKEADTATRAAPARTGGLAKGADTRDDGGRMIRGMVDGLEQRLTAAPDDAEGWVKLMRSRMVLGESEKASVALTRARQTFAGRADVLARIEAAARELGVVR